MSKSWDDKELKLFIAVYPTMPMKKMVKIFKRTKGALQTKANGLGIARLLKSDGKRYYTKDELEYVKNNYSIKSIKEISQYLGRAINSVKDMAYKLNVTSSFWWTDKEESFLRKNYKNKDADYISKHLGKTWEAIRRKARKMGLYRLKKDGDEYEAARGITKKEKLFILKNYSIMTSSEMAKKLNRSTVFIETSCTKLKVSPMRMRKNPLQYSDKDLLDFLIVLAKEIGRTPSIHDVQKDKRITSIDTYYDRFGTFSNALVLAGTDINNNNTYGKRCLSKNGDICFSIPEKTITDYFIDNKIGYRKEILYSAIIPSVRRKYRVDWVLNKNIFVEYFGLDNKQYNKKTKDKIKICKKNNIALIQIYYDDLSRLNEIFKNIK